MLYRKIYSYIENHLLSGSDKVLILQGARQVGKSFAIREVGTKLFPNFVELNFARDNDGPRIFKNIRTTDDFYFMLGSQAGTSLGTYDDTLIFLDEIQEYPQFLTMLKFLREERRFRFIASGSLLGIALGRTTSIPVGSIIIKDMYQLDFEEFLIACGSSLEAIDMMRSKFADAEPLSEEMHAHMMNMFRRYLLVGGMPDAVNEYLATRNIVNIREIQRNIMTLYRDDALKYEKNSSRRLAISRIYSMIPSQMENKKKRIVAKDIDNTDGARFDKYREEFEYLTGSGIAIGVNAVSNPKFPLTESLHKNLMKLYLNDVGLLTCVLYRNNIEPIVNDIPSINLGATYETAVAQELKAHDNNMVYYDNKKLGEVDFLVDDYATTSVLPIEVKSGRDYSIHSAIDRLVSNPEYHIREGLVLCNNREYILKNGILHMPIYNIMFINPDRSQGEVTF